MKNLLRWGLIVGVCGCASSCWVPEQFTASLDIDENRQYRFSYDGTIAYGPALGAIAESGQLSAADEAEVARGVGDLRATPGITSAEYVGRGRFRISFSQAGSVRPGENLFLDLVQFRSDRSGGVRIRGPAISPEDRREFDKIDLKLDGTIRLRSKIPVVEHNAASTPWFGGLFGAYKWRVTSAQTEIPTVLLRGSEMTGSGSGPREGAAARPQDAVTGRETVVDAPEAGDLTESLITPAEIRDPDGFTNVRAGPSASSAVISKVRTGEVFYTTTQVGDWWLVRTHDDAIGYMHRSRIVLKR